MMDYRTIWLTALAFFLVAFFIIIMIWRKNYKKRKALQPPPPPPRAAESEPAQFTEWLERGLCPFCRGEVEKGALKCKHCGEWIDSKHRSKAEAMNAKVQQSQLATGALARFIGAMLVLGIISTLLMTLSKGC